MTILEFRKPEPARSPARPTCRASAEESLLAWLIALPDGVDPAQAAKAALDAAPASTAGTPSGVRLRALLSEVARWPARDRAAFVPLRRRGRSRARA